MMTRSHAQSEQDGASSQTTTVLEPSNIQWRPIPKPVFEGLLLEDPDAFMTAARQYFDASQISDATSQLQGLKTLLSGAASSWYKQYDGLLFDIEEFEERFTERFSGKAVLRELKVALYDTRQRRGEAAETYLLRKRRIWTRLNSAEALTEAAAAYAAVRGLTDAYASRMYAQTYASFRDAIRKAREVDAELSPAPAVTMEAAQPKSAAPTAPTAPARSARAAAPAVVASSAAPATRASEGRRDSLPRCWHCQGQHYIRNCPSRQTPTPSGNATPASESPIAGPARR